MSDTDRPLALHIAGPGRVAINLHRTAPVIAYYAAPLRSLGKETFVNAAAISAVCIETNKVFTGRVRVNRESPLPRGSEHARERVSGVEAHHLDLRKCLNIPWVEATYVVTLIMGNLTSNRIQLRLARSDWVFRDAEVEKFLAARRRQLMPSPVSPAPAASRDSKAQSLPWYRRLPESPEVPSMNGIALKSAPPSTIYGSFRLSIAGRDITKYEHNKFVFMRTTAIVPISILLASANGAFQINLRVPSFSAIDQSAAAQTANGFFAVDLSRLEGVPKLPESFSVYALSGEAIAGPLELLDGPVECRTGR